ncbi:phage tail tape measure protein [Iodobacter sp.]|uniref:phage tail tape measure protein n=1 Tax=Iodobacter sp. TaxID=1915058 RepID=UPI0025CD1A55|nr:phage tail tape measure protein [Iodobacter sp.]
MSRNMEVSLLLRARDQASAVLTRLSQAAAQMAAQMAQSSAAGQHSTQSAYRQTTRVYERSVGDQNRLAQRAAQAVAQAAASGATQAAQAQAAGQQQVQQTYRQTTQVFERATGEQRRLAQRAAQAVAQAATSGATQVAQAQAAGQARTQQTYRQTTQVFERVTGEQRRLAQRAAQAVAQAAASGATQVAQSTNAAQMRIRTAYRQTTQAYDRAVGDQSRLAQRAAQAREQLGIRSEKAIQREIQQTEAAYRQLSRSAVLSAAEQSRAYDATRQRVSVLRREMGLLENQQRTIADRAKTMGRGGAAAVVGVMAGAAVLTKPVGETMSYDRRLALMSNTAFSGRNVTGRLAGRGELSNAINVAVRTGGGTRESAADTLDGLLASGAMNNKTAMNLLPTLQKYATGTGADPKELGNIAIRAMQTFSIKEKDLPKALDMAIVAGQEGGFELKDLAKWLPQQMAAGKGAGLSGLQGLTTLLAANQAAVITAGSKDEAGNNLVNLLAKITSQDTAKDASKLNIDLTGTLIKAREKGMNGLDAFVGIVDKVVGKDKRYAELKKRAGKETGEEKKATLESMGDIVQASTIGKLIQDRQALMALIGRMNNREYVKGIETKLDEEKQKPIVQGAGEANYQTIASTDAFKAEQLKNEAVIAQQKAMIGLNGVIGDAAVKLTDYAKKYPELTTALAGATTAVTALGAAAAGAGVTMLATGGKTISTVPPVTPVPSVAPVTAASTSGILGRFLGPAMLAGSVANFSTVEDDAESAKRIKQEKAYSQRLQSTYSPEVITAARDQFKPWYDLGIEEKPSRTESWVKQYLQEQQAKPPQKVEVTVKVENGNITAAVNEKNQQAARRY